MTVTFADEGKKTKVTAQMLFESSALRDQTVKQFGASRIEANPRTSRHKYVMSTKEHGQ